MTHHSLLGALPLLAQALSRKYGVRVEIGGERAFTDGKTIHLPGLPLEAEEGRIEVLANGYLDHEAAHVRLTDFTVSRGETPLLQAFTNILEDLRVDLRMGETYPGCRVNTRRLDTQLLRDGDYTVPAGDAHPGAVLAAYLLNRGRQQVVGVEAMAPLADQTEAVFRSRFPPGLATRLGAALYQIPHLQSTVEVVALARELVRRVGEAAENPDPPPANTGTPDAPDGANGTGDSPLPASQPAGDDPGSPDGANGTGDHPLPASAEAASSARPQPAGSDAPDASLPAFGTADPRAALRAALAAQPTDLPQDRGQILGGKLADAAAEADGILMALPAGTGARAGSEGAALVLSGPAVDLTAVRLQTARLRARLQGRVQASRLARSHPSRTGTRLDTGQLHRLAVRNPRVFTARRERPAVDTAVLLLIDRSGSMKHRLDIARSAVLAAALALESIPRVQIATGAFPTDREAGLALLTPFGQRVDRTLDRYRFGVDGGTPLAEALLHGASLLAPRRERRQIILVATDGQPDDPDHAKDVIGWLGRCGVEMLGLGIRCPVDTLFPAARMITDLGELAPALFGLLQERLTSGKPAV